MRKSLWLCVLVLLLSNSTAAQDVPKAEVFGGYSSLSNFGGTVHGWNASVGGNVNRVLSIVGDFAGYYQSSGGIDTSEHYFTFGPRLTARREKFTAFAHFLAGASHRRSSGLFSFSDTLFATNIGGGFDINANQRVAIRIVQVDLASLWTSSGSGHAARISVGVVLRLGKK